MSPRHHTVPQFYLRNFADDAGQVVLVDRDDTSRAHRTTVRKAVSEVGFYRLDPDAFAVDKGERPDPEVVEHHLGKFEQAAAPGISKLARGNLASVTQHDWYHVINLMALQTVRGNRFREDVEAAENQALRVYLGETVTDDQIRTWLEARGDPTTPASISEFRKEMLGPKRPRLLPTQEHLIQQGLKLALGALGERLADDMNWTLIEADRARVLTSDEPVCWWAPGEDPVGFGNAAIVWFPVSRRYILQLRHRDAALTSVGLPDPSTSEPRPRPLQAAQRFARMTRRLDQSDVQKPRG